jgi:hypothetical protein
MGPSATKWSVVNSLVTFGGRIFIPVSSPCVAVILESAHGVGHEGMQSTLHCLQANFFVPCARTVVQEFVHACLVCRKKKAEQLHLVSLLQPLAVQWCPRTYRWISSKALHG